MAKVKDVEPDHFKKRRKSKKKSKDSKPKVGEVQPSELRKKHKIKGRSKKSKRRHHKSPKTDLKQAQNVSSNAAPSHRVQEGEVDKKAMIDKSAEQSQVVQKTKHRSTTESPSKVIYSSLVKIAEYVKLAHEAAGRTAATVNTQHLRKSINSGISTALDEVQMSGRLQPEQTIEQKLRDKVSECIHGKSPYTKSRQVLVTLNDFIHCLQSRATPAQQSDKEVKKEGEVWGEHKNRDLGPGQMHCTRPQARPGQLRKGTTFSRNIILVIWRRRILVHLRAMTKDEFLGVVESSFRMISHPVDTSRALIWLSHATITDSGNVKVSIHSKDSKELETVTEGMTTAWAKALQNEVEQSNKVFEVLVPNFPVEPVTIADPGRKAETIEQLVRTNAPTISSSLTTSGTFNSPRQTDKPVGQLQ